MRTSASLPCSGAIAIPMLQVTCSRTPSRSKGTESESSSRSAKTPCPPGIRHSQNKRELVAAEPRDQITLLRKMLEAFCNLAQKHVACGMALAVVDVLEVIDIDIEQRNRLFPT
jgi:hypothetical protein